MAAESLEVLENFKGAIIYHAVAIDFQDALACTEPGSHSLGAWGTGAREARVKQRSQVPVAPGNSCIQSCAPQPGADQRGAADTAKAAGPMWYLRPLAFGTLPAWIVTD